MSDASDVLRRVVPAVVSALVAALVALGCSPEAEPPRLSPIDVPATPDAATLLRDLDRWDAATSHERSLAALAVHEATERFRFRELRLFASLGSAHEIAIFEDVDTGAEFVLIPGWRFVKRPLPWDELGEEHAVLVPEPFLLARRPVTHGLRSRIAGSRTTTPARLVGDMDSEDAVAFCARAGLDVPLSSQWELACVASRGASTGSAKRIDYRDPEFAALGNGTAPDALGLLYMYPSANVIEWCRSDATGGDPAADRPGDDLEIERRPLVHRVMGRFGCGEASTRERPGPIEALEAGRGRYGVRPARMLRLVPD